MMKPDWRPALDAAHHAALRWLESVDHRPIRPDDDFAAAHGRLDGSLPLDGTDPAEVIAALASHSEPGLLAVNSPRFHGWVNGGATPAGIAADWLVAAWDQNAAMAGPTPASSATEAITARWLLELLGLPAESGVGFVTGGQVANLVCLAAARSGVSRAYGWDVDTNGMSGGPPITVIVSEQAHSTIGKALRILGFGEGTALTVPTDANARHIPDELERRLSDVDGPVIVCTQAGDVNTGGIDRFSEIANIVDHARTLRPDGGAWLHVDGAIGLWGLASDRLRPDFAGIERADSWSTDAHKWLNTPYDCGVAITARPDDHRRAMSLRAAYLPDDLHRNPIDWNPEMSRRSRATPLYATIRALGKSGIVEMIERTTDMARLYAHSLSGQPGVEVLNEVELNQVLVRFLDKAGNATTHTPAVLARLQDSGVAYPTATMWDGQPAMRISVCNWMTGPEDVEVTSNEILTIHRQLRED